MGPLVTAASRDRVAGFVDAGEAAGATLVVVPGVKHYLHIERAAELAVLVTDFLHRVDP